MSVVAASTLPICKSFICSPPYRSWGAKTIARWQYSGKVVQLAFILKVLTVEPKRIRCHIHAGGAAAHCLKP
jgi:hypothetical protein